MGLLTVGLLAASLLGLSCAGGTPPSPSSAASRPTSTTAAASPPSTTMPPAPTSTAELLPPPAFDARATLEPLVVDDRPRPDRPYRREEWPHWDDIDDNGCDGREDALLIATREPAELGPACKVLSGEWVSPYDGIVTTDPSAIQIDHLVPLENAFTSGGWRWEASRRRLFANDQQELVATSGPSNQSKGAKTPDQWRPTERSVWCAYAVAWVRVKVTYDLTVTTAERDALGQMLDTCGPDTPADARPGGPAGPSAPVVGPPTDQAPVAPVAPPPDGEVFFANCAAARAAGAAPIRRGEPGYRDRLDGDGDGVACE